MVNTSSYHYEDEVALRRQRQPLAVVTVIYIQLKYIFNPDTKKLGGGGGDTPQ